MVNQADFEWAKETLAKCIAKYARVVPKHKDGIPYTTDENGCYDNRAGENKPWQDDDGICWWTNGFWGGIIWHLYAETGEEQYLKIARHSEELLDRCFEKYYGLHHDVGFMWIPTSVTDYILTGNEAARKRALHAANLLAGRFNIAGNYIRAWNSSQENDTKGWAIIDCMMNIPLLYWASKEIGDPRYRHIAIAHADTVMNTFIRENGSSNHIVEYDAEKGGVIKTYGGQGYSDGSAWTRGQAWAMYGFILSYKHTEKPEYLQTAKKVSDYFIAQMPESGLIPVDFEQPAEPALEDSCGASIAACALIETAKYCDTDTRQKYLNAALKILRALDGNRCDYGQDCDAIVGHCTGAYHSKDRHIHMVYADYFFMEAFTKLKGASKFIW